MRRNLKKLLSVAAFCLTIYGFGQVKTISGQVLDADGFPVHEAFVHIDGETEGVYTDENGKYTLEAEKGDRVLVEYVFTEIQDQVVGEANTYNFKLVTAGEIELDAVVTTALNIERNPESLSYSVTELKGEDLTETPATNTATAMVGKISGLQINTINNGVNPSTRVVFRGARSLLGNNQALIVIDGFPSSSDALDRLNAADIASVTALKGANASALYGSDASNGVLIITTKKGNGKLSVQFNSSTQIETVAYLPELQDQFGAGGFPDGTLYPLENVAWGPRYDGRLVDASETYANGDVWQVPYSPIKDVHKNFFDKGLTFKNGIQVSAGDETSDFLMSIDHSLVSGTMPKDQFNRTNFRIKANKELGKLSVGANVSFFRSHYNTVSAGGRQGRPIYWNILNTPLHIPLSKMKNWKDGYYTRNEVSFFRFYENPYFILDTQRQKGDFSDVTIQAHADYNFTDYLSATLRTGYSSYTSRYKQELGGMNIEFKVPDPYSNVTEFNPSTASNLGNGTNFNTDFILSFNKDIFEGINLNIIGGYNVKMTDYKSVNVSGENLIIPDFYNVSTRTGELGGGEYFQEERSYGVYTEATLGINDWIYLTGIARNDWTSTLPVENNSYFYPGGGLSLVPTEVLPQLESSIGMNFLKLYGNVTKTGSPAGVHKTSSVFYSPSNFPYGDVPGLSQGSQIVNLDLKPEFTLSKEAGFEFEFLKGRIAGAFAIYQTNTTDQLIPVNISYASGASSLYTNLGETENIGYEAELSLDILRSREKDISWNVSANFTKNESKVVELKDGVEEVNIGGYTAANIVARVGEAYPLMKTTAYVKDPQGRIVVGANGDPIQDGDLQIQGHTNPDFILGLNSRFKYKNFSIYAVADYRTGHVFYNNLVNALEFTGLTQHSATAGRGRFVFPNSSYQTGTDASGNPVYEANTNRLTSGGGNAFWSAYGDVEENYVTDASAWKLREVSINYEIVDLFKNTFVESMKLGLYGRNLITWRPADNVYTDPEFAYSEGNTVGLGSQYQSPPTRQYGFTMSINF